MRLAQEQAAELNGVLQERTTKLAQAEAQVRQLAKSLEEAQAATSAAHASAREQLTQQTRIHEEERRIAGERAATNERRLNAEVDRARQDAKAAREDAAQAIALAKRECEREAQATRKASARAEQLQVVCEQLRAEVTRAEQATALAKDFAERLERELPQLVVSRMTKSLRPGKVLIDWSQNNGSKTTVAPYSLRARERPTVSTPVTWDEVTDCRAPQDMFFTAPDVLNRVEARGDLFAPLLATLRT